MNSLIADNIMEHLHEVCVTGDLEKHSPQAFGVLEWIATGNMLKYLQ